MALNLLEELKRLLDALTEEAIDYALCGDIAVNIHGHVRSTNDINLLVREEDVGQVLSLLQSLNFDFTSGPVPFQAETAKERKLYRATQIQDAAAVTVDVLVITPVLEDVWRSRETFAWMNREVTAV